MEMAGNRQKERVRREREEGMERAEGEWLGERALMLLHHHMLLHQHTLLHSIVSRPQNCHISSSSPSPKKIFAFSGLYISN